MVDTSLGLGTSVTIKDIELKPCPFCGNETFFDFRTAEKHRWIECRLCGVRSPMVVSDDDEDAIEAWNDRYNEHFEYTTGETPYKYGFSSPVAPGDMVWVLACCVPRKGKSEFVSCERMDGYKVLLARVVNVHLTKDRATFKLAIAALVRVKYPEWQFANRPDDYVFKEYISLNFPYGAIGKTVFYTKKEAIDTLERQIDGQHRIQ